MAVTPAVPDATTQEIAAVVLIVRLAPTMPGRSVPVEVVTPELPIKIGAVVVFVIVADIRPVPEIPVRAAMTDVEVVPQAVGRVVAKAAEPTG
jgi:hypothetical protein